MSTVDVKPTNRKPAAKADAPNEPFKRALASCTRALARQPELEITFSADKPSLLTSPEGVKARLPEPPRKPNPREAAIVRGLADLFALRLACHNDAIHRRLGRRARRRAPCSTRSSRRGSRPSARAACRAWRRTSPPCSTTATTAALRRSAHAEEAPLEDAVAMLARERLTGLEPPRRRRASGRALAPRIEEKAGADLDRLGAALLDQRAYARLVARSFVPGARQRSDRRRGIGRRDGRQDAARGRRRGRRRGRGPVHAGSMQREAADDTADDAEEGAIDTVEAPSSELDDEGEAGEAEEAAESRPPQPQAPEGAGPTTRPITTRFDEIVTPTNCATPKNCSACATISTSSCRTSIRWSPASPTGCSGA